ncbi:polyprenyl synthetase family protein [Dechloromonas denitrificans]|uniref:polyprenyl synthetase family protein n=1 Tax=Dechloromonas denitrificans TaxID=281362 RepID=UPI001CF8CABB|nr:polyprenyl synthetase family protein [Dechloromonas denitrificans]UCV03397.1 polyprenyl synthetase family protein [Dechloromonas denitrificans]
MTLPAALDTLIRDDFAQVDEVIRKYMNQDVVLIRHAVELIIDSGEFRIRPALTLLTAGALGYAGPHRHALAAAIELIHGSLVLHHAVDELAGGAAAASENASLLGNAGNILLGDLLYTGAFRIIVDIGDMRLMQVLSDATTMIAEGEVMHLTEPASPEQDLARHIAILRARSAKLFEAASQCAAIIAAASLAVEQMLAAYGLHLGSAYQVWREPAGPVSGAAEKLAGEESALASAAIAPLAESPYKSALLQCAAWAGQHAPAAAPVTTRASSTLALH